MRDMVGDVADDVADIQQDMNSLEKELKDTENYIKNPLASDSKEPKRDTDAESATELSVETSEIPQI